MHIFSCRVQDEVRIGDSMRVVVLDVAGNHVRLGIRSPGRIPEYQEEVIYLAASPETMADEPAPADLRLVEI